MKKYLNEFVGTLIFVLTIGCSVIGNRGPLVPLAIASALMVVVYAGGHISGGHYNPAVTVAVWLRGKHAAGAVVPYWLAQCLGAAVGALLVRYLFGAPPSSLSLSGAAIPKAMLAEFAFTFALAFVVLNTATAKGTANNSNYGLAIGFTVLCGAVSVGSISGGAFNPAVAVGLGVMQLVEPSSLWVHIVSELVGAATAAIVFRFVAPDDDSRD